MEGYFPGYGNYGNAASKWDNHRLNIWVEGHEGEIYDLDAQVNDIGLAGISFGNRFDAQPKLKWYDGSIIDSKAFENNFKEAEVFPGNPAEQQLQPFQHPHQGRPQAQRRY